MKVLVFGYRYKDVDQPYIQKVLDKLTKENIEIFAFNDYLEDISQGVTLPTGIQGISTNEEFTKSNIDFVLTLGGDGTILKAVTITKDSGVPILGINLGRLGFFSSHRKNYG